MKPVLRQLDIRDQNSSPRWHRHRTLKTGLNVEKGRSMLETTARPEDCSRRRKGQSTLETTEDTEVNGHR